MSPRWPSSSRKSAPPWPKPKPEPCAPKPPIRRARQALDVARKPLAEAERRAQRLDTEAKTLAKLLHVDTKNLWPAVLDDLTVEKGYETALGAALGDDLEAPVDPQAPMRWAGADIDPDRSGAAGGCRAAREATSRRRRNWRAGWRRSA